MATTAVLEIHLGRLPRAGPRRPSAVYVLVRWSACDLRTRALVDGFYGVCVTDVRINQKLCSTFVRTDDDAGGRAVRAR